MAVLLRSPLRAFQAPPAALRSRSAAPPGGAGRCRRTSPGSGSNASGIISGCEELWERAGSDGGSGQERGPGTRHVRHPDSPRWAASGPGPGAAAVLPWGRRPLSERGVPAPDRPRRGGGPAGQPRGAPGRAASRLPLPLSLPRAGPCGRRLRCRYRPRCRRVRSPLSCISQGNCRRVTWVCDLRGSDLQLERTNASAPGPFLSLNGARHNGRPGPGWLQCSWTDTVWGAAARSWYAFRLPPLHLRSWKFLIGLGLCSYKGHAEALRCTACTIRFISK